MPDNIALSVKNLSKCYQLYNKPQDRLKQAVLSGRKYYEEFWALRDINLEIKKGEAFGIIGRNGSGKSTLLQLLCKTLTPTSGEIIVNGKVAALLELGAGFNPEFTGRENVYINGAILGLTRQEIDARFDDIAGFADIGNFMDQPVKSYSSGMFVRLAFAVQACVSPDILIIDEALAVGDVFFRQKCYQLLDQFLAKGTSIILVSHAMGEVEQFCQRALVLRNGETKFLGASSEAVKHYYLLEQAARSLPTEAENHLIEDHEPASDQAFFWPAPSAFLDISQINQVTNDGAICKSVALCNNEGQPCLAFQQGDTASFFYEFELFQDIEVPATGLIIRNEKGINVHGKGTTEYGTHVPQSAKKGDVLRIRQDIRLELALGEYTFEVGLASMSQAHYAQRTSAPISELYAAVMRLCHLTQVNCFSILPRSHGVPVQLMHHGIANLPGDCRMVKVVGAGL